MRWLVFPTEAFVQKKKYTIEIERDLLKVTVCFDIRRKTLSKILINHKKSEKFISLLEFKID